MAAEDVEAKGATERGKRQVDLGSQARYWPTPVAHDDNKSPEAHLAMKARMPGGPRSTVTSLNVAAKLWHTPTAAEGRSGVGEHTSRGGASNLRPEVSARPTPRARDEKGKGYTDGLPTTVQQWATPRASDRENRQTKDQPSVANGHGRALAAMACSRPDPTTTTVGGNGSPPAVLNPAFVEALMGWPPGWTDCGSSVTVASLSRWRSLSSSLLAELGCGVAE